MWHVIRFGQSLLMCPFLKQPKHEPFTLDEFCLFFVSLLFEGLAHIAHIHEMTFVTKQAPSFHSISSFIVELVMTQFLFATGFVLTLAQQRWQSYCSLFLLGSESHQRLDPSAALICLSRKSRRPLNLALRLPLSPMTQTIIRRSSRSFKGSFETRILMLVECSSSSIQPASYIVLKQLLKEGCVRP